MALIETEEAAGRLARVIVSDIEIYNRQKIASGGDLSRELEEGFSLFQSRVVPALLPLFESVLSDRGLLGGKLPPALARAAARYADLRSDADGRAPQTETVAEPAPEPVSAPDPDATPAPVAAEAPTETGNGEAHAPVTEDAATAAAKRLARVIVSDIVLYNTKKIAAGGELGRELQEGRALFKSRVAAEHIPLFEALLVERGLLRPPEAEVNETTRPDFEPPASLRASALAADMPTPVMESAAPYEPPTPVVQVSSSPSSPSPDEALTPVIEALPQASEARLAAREATKPSNDDEPYRSPFAAFAPAPLAAVDPAETPPPAAASGAELPSPFDAPERARRPLPPPIPAAARAQAVREAALDLARPEPRRSDSNPIMTSALALPGVSDAPAAALPTAAASEPPSPLDALRALAPLPAPAPAQPPAAAFATLPMNAPDRPAPTVTDGRKAAKTRLIVAGVAILSAAATTYYLLSFWPSR